MRWVLSFFGLMFVIFLVLFFGTVLMSIFTVVGVARGATTQECVSYLNGQELLLPCEEAWLIRTDAEPPCLKLMEASMRERDAVDALQKQVDNFYRWDNGTITITGNVIGTWSSEPRLGTHYKVTPEGYIVYDYQAPSEYHPPVKKTEEELYEEKKAAILKQIADLDDERERTREQVTRDAHYQTLKADLEKARQFLILDWATTQKECYR